MRRSRAATGSRIARGASPRAVDFESDPHVRRRAATSSLLVRFLVPPWRWHSRLDLTARQSACFKPPARVADYTICRSVSVLDSRTHTMAVRIGELLLREKRISP